MNLCRALYGHGCTCGCTQGISKPAAVSWQLWPCWALSTLDLFCAWQKVCRWFEASCALRAHLAGEVRAVLSSFLTACSGPSELAGPGCARSPGCAMAAVWELGCEGSWLGLYVLICGTGHLGRERKQLQKESSWLTMICWFMLSIPL